MNDHLNGTSREAPNGLGEKHERGIAVVDDDQTGGDGKEHTRTTSK